MVFLFFYFHVVQAEYRAFEHEITNVQTKQARMVASSLDPDQYPGYYPLQANEVLQMKNTWMCYGDTSYRTTICPNPRPENKQSPPVNANPSSSNPQP